MRAAADRIDWRPLDSLTPSARNTRKHSDAQIDQLASSIDHFGWTMPILVDEAGEILAGHGRVLAAQRLGHETVPVIVAKGWSDAQKRAYLIADNKLGLNSAWDDARLKVELQELQCADFDLGLTGFEPAELSRLVGTVTAGLTDPDAAPRSAPASRVALGEVWRLGVHRVACGDSTDADVVAAALAETEPFLMVSDPPYGVAYKADWRNHAFRSDGSPIGGRAVGTVSNDDRADWRDAWALFPGAVAYIWHASTHASRVQASLEAVEFEIRAQIIWEKAVPVIGRGHYHFQHEPCWYVVRKGRSANWRGGRKQSTVWRIAHRKSETGHSTQKPVECMRRPIVNHTAQGEGVYDPFLGSGTTLIAAEMTGRVCCGVEIDPAYVDVIIDRWERFTGRRAEREA